MINDGTTIEQPNDKEAQLQISEKINKDEVEQSEKISRFRTALPQVLASTAKNLILMDLGMTIAFPTIVIPALLKNQLGGETFSVSDASWFGSIAFICQPVGSVLSGIVLEPLGRKYSLLIVNFPHILGWLLFYSATSIRTVFIANIIMGLGVGFMEAPIITYVGEICEPKLRGMLISYSGLFFNFGVVIIYGLGNLTDWQTAALISTLVPIITVIAITQVPETPYWLLSRGRYSEAEKSLCWLRGWVKPHVIQKEFQEMKRYSESTKLQPIKYDKPTAAYTNPVCTDDEKAISKGSNENSTNKNDSSNASGNKEQLDNTQAADTFVTVELPEKAKENDVNSVNNNNLKKAESDVHKKITFSDYCKDLTRPEMLKPLALVISFFFFQNFAGINAMRPFQVEIFKNLGFPINPYRATVVMSITGFIATVLCMALVKYLGKRPLSLIALFCSAATVFSLSVYAKLNDVGKEGVEPHISWVPFTLYFTLQFFFSFGVAQVPWMLVSEVFPNRGRSQASGVAAACSYILSFLATKTFLGLQATLTLSGVLCLYGFCTVLGLITMYIFLLETEGKSLEEIENYFISGNKK